MPEDNTKKVIADQWVQLLYSTLEKLSDSYIRMHEGCADLIEFMSLADQKQEIDRLQYKNAGFIITYLRTILINGQSLFSEIEYKDLTTKVEIIDQFHSTGILHEGELISVYQIEKSDLTRKNRFKLMPAFDILVKKIDFVYLNLIKNIQGILFLEGNIRNKPIKIK